MANNILITRNKGMLKSKKRGQREQTMSTMLTQQSTCFCCWDDLSHGLNTLGPLCLWQCFLLHNLFRVERETAKLSSVLTLTEVDFLWNSNSNSDIISVQVEQVYPTVDSYKVKPITTCAKYLWLGPSENEYLRISRRLNCRFKIQGWVKMTENFSLSTRLNCRINSL